MQPSAGVYRALLAAGVVERLAAPDEAGEAVLAVTDVGQLG